MDIKNITADDFKSALPIEGPQNFPPGHYRVTCITKPLTLFKERGAMHTYPGLFTVAHLNSKDEADSYVVISTDGSLPPKFLVKDDGSVEKQGFWPPEDDRPMGVKFSD